MDSLKARSAGLQRIQLARAGSDGRPNERYRKSDLSEIGEKAQIVTTYLLRLSVSRTRGPPQVPTLASRMARALV